MKSSCRFLVWNKERNLAEYTDWYTVDITIEVMTYFKENKIGYYPTVNSVIFNSKDDILVFCLKFNVQPMRV
jgi:hypothetical protein